MEDKNITRAIGTGLTYPIIIDNGKPVVKSGPELVMSDLTLLFAWPTLSRFFKESYGIDLKKFLEEPNDDVLFDILRTYVIWAIEEWEPRVNLESTEISRDELGIGLNINLSFSITSVPGMQELIIPVYSMTA